LNVKVQYFIKFDFDSSGKVTLICFTDLETNQIKTMCNKIIL